MILREEAMLMRCGAVRGQGRGQGSMFNDRNFIFDDVLIFIPISSC